MIRIGHSLPGRGTVMPEAVLPGGASEQFVEPGARLLALLIHEAGDGAGHSRELAVTLDPDDPERDDHDEARQLDQPVDHHHPRHTFMRHENHPPERSYRARPAAATRIGRE